MSCQNQKKNAHIATLFALLIQFLPTPGTAPLYIPPALFLVFSVLALPRLVQALTSARRPESNSVHFLTPSPSKPSWFFGSGTSPHSKSASAGNKRKPITIHVATHRTSTSYPLSLPSPSSSNSFPLSESVSSHEHELGCNSLRQHNYNQQGGEIELEISLPCRHSGRFERKGNRNSQGYSYHDLHCPDRISLHSEEKLQLGRRQEDKHKVELHRSSVDSSSSTLTANTDRKLERTSSFNRVLTPPPLTRIRLPTIASAGSSNVELQISNSTSNQGIVEIGSVPNSIRFGNLFTGNIDNRSTRTGRSTSIQARTPSGSIHHHPREQHHGLLNQLRFTRARSCLVFLIAAQVTALVAYACAVGVEVVRGGYQSGMWISSKPFFVDRVANGGIWNGRYHRTTTAGNRPATELEHVDTENCADRVYGTCCDGDDVRIFSYVNLPFFFFILFALGFRRVSAPCFYWAFVCFSRASAPFYQPFRVVPGWPLHCVPFTLPSCHRPSFSPTMGIEWNVWACKCMHIGDG